MNNLTRTRPNVTNPDRIRNTTNLPGTNVTGLPGWSRFDDIFESMFPEITRKDSSTRIQDVDDNLRWSIDMPGVGEDNIEVVLQDDKITVKTSYDDTEEEEDHSRVERRHYSRTLKLGNHIDTENIEASYENGVLTVSLPKVEQTEVKRKIELD